MYYNELYHHGIKGQRWGVRRYQNEDGTLTEVGMRRLSGGGKKDKGVSFDEHGRLANDPSNLRKAHSKIRENVAEDYRNVSSAFNSGSNIAGISSRMAIKAVDNARKEGIKAGAVKLLTLWPLDEEYIASVVAGKKLVVVPEMNRGQLVYDIQRISEGKLSPPRLTAVTLKLQTTSFGSLQR